MTNESLNFDQICQTVDKMAGTLQLHKPGTIPTALATEPTLAERRARKRPGPRRDVLTLSLIEGEGMVFWEVGSPVRPELRRSRRAGGFLGCLISQKQTPVLGSNQITGYLENLDSTLTPLSGIQQWTAQGLKPNPSIASTGKILLFVHGTFSNSAHLFAEIQSTPEGSAFLARALASYNQVLAFDHPTVSASPIVNAIDLRNALGSCRADIDIVCHSRGGLVSRWWMELLDSLPTRNKRAVFVGSPLTGTSLAAPDKLRYGLKLLSTYATLLGGAAMAAPLLNAPAALLVIFGSLARAASSVPLIDAGVAMIPGLNGQSRVANSLELTRLNRACTSFPAQYFFVSSNFEPERAGWNVLKRARQIAIRTANTLADTFVFPGDNDLVVDTQAMMAPWTLGLNPTNSLKFDAAKNVHHTIYFQQRKTIDFIAHSLGIT